ncbi:helix-turn-helix domain-containing protein [Clostridium autoethanogenum]|uniref:Helix-turn-helix domain-containing protein n=1 Tax=Clostridium autoethanogenum TaxID=84023 RepID=A0A3M0S5E8_9CLOT|nr:helix-turn-helix domain-containing protein [Clostridium autoethanogenum]RMC93782.1 helix-turn-helix domain-containing protein [Clostridium autoethanogenum]
MSNNKFVESNSKGQTYIDNAYLYDTRLTSTEKTVYAVLCSACYGDKCETYVGQLTIAKAINKSLRTVQRSIKTLKGFSYIQIKRRGSISNITTIISKQMRKTGQKVISTVKSAYKAYKQKINIDKQEKKTLFNSFKQRNYNFKNLENMLLGNEEYDPEKLE